MILSSKLVQLGYSPNDAKHLGYTPANSLTATGNNSQANAYQITESVSIFTTTTGTDNSCKLPVVASASNSRFVIKNLGTSELNIYPASGEYIYPLAVNTGFPLGSGFAVELIVINSNSWTILNVANAIAIDYPNSEITYIPTFTSETGVSVTPAAPTLNENNLWYSIITDGTNKLADFVFGFALTLGAGASPRYIDMTLPFTVAASHSWNIPWFGTTNNGAAITLGLARVEAPAPIRTQFRVWYSFNLTGTFTASAVNYVSFFGLVKID